MPDTPLGRIIRLVGARALNTLGRQVINFTVLWELYKRTDSTLAIMGVGMVQVLPVILLFIYAGEFVDRSDRRRVATVCAVANGLVGLGIAIASWTTAPIATYYVLLFAQGVIAAFFAPANGSIVPLIIERQDLDRANRIGASAYELGSVVGPAIAGLALLVWAPKWIYGVVAITGIAAGALYRSLPEPRKVAMPAVNARKDWRVGLRFIFRSPLLLPALTLDMFAVLFAGVVALLPVIAEKLLHTDALGYGILRASEPVGAIAMSFIGGRIRPWQRPGRVLLIVVAAFGLCTCAIGLSPWLPLTAGLLVICGALDNISVVIRTTLEQVVVPDAIRGRVSAVHYVFIGMSNELGAAESGGAAYLVGVLPAIVGGGAVAMAVVGVVALVWPQLSKMPPLAELHPPDEAPSGSAPPASAAP